MELPPPRQSVQQTSTDQEAEVSSMSTLVMQAPSSIISSPRDLVWDERSSLSIPSRRQSQIGRIELPSIRQAIPEIELRAHRGEEQGGRGEAGKTSPRAPVESLESWQEWSSLRPTYKKRRLSEENMSAVARGDLPPRVYRSPRRQHVRVQSGTQSPSIRRESVYSAGESWSNSNRGSPYLPVRSAPTAGPPAVFESPARNDFRPTLPSLPSLTLDRGPASQVPRGRNNNWSEYALDSSRPGSQTYPPPSGPTYDSPSSHSSYHSPAVGYSYQQPRGQSYSAPNHSLHDRSPFSASGYHPVSHEPYLHDLVPNGMPDGSQQRKRRGNLPKDTIDTLRTWFVAHLTHPYPTEDEKQDLMRQTGLQMNQISNWFINARRRQLPAMINNAKAESDARSARSGDAIPRRRSDPRVLESESEGYEDEYETLERPRSSIKGESI